MKTHGKSPDLSQMTPAEELALHEINEMMANLESARNSAAKIAQELINNEPDISLEFAELPLLLQDYSAENIRFVIRRRLENFLLKYNDEFFVGRRSFCSHGLFFSRRLHCFLLVFVKTEPLQCSNDDFQNFVLRQIEEVRVDMTRLTENPPVALVVSVSEQCSGAKYESGTLKTEMVRREYLSILPPVGLIEEELASWVDELKKPVWKRWRDNSARRMVDLDFELLMEGLRRVFMHYPDTGKKAVFF